MNIAILGFGTVGKGVAEIVSKKEGKTKEINIKKILVREGKLSYFDGMSKESLFLDENVKFITNIDDIVNDKSIDLVVECMGGVSPAFEYVEKCLKNGKKIVTSNKMLLAMKYNEIVVKFKNQIKYEATVGGGIHIFHSINDVKKVDSIKSFKGIVNGTTNFILSKMTDMVLNDNNCSENIFSDVLKEAQNLGFAEADPTNDVEGYDAMYKAVLLHNEIFGDVVTFDKSKAEGISHITKDDIINANSENKVIKLIAYGDSKNTYVKPMRIDKNDYLAHVNSNLNCILLESENLGVSAYVGQGAGKLPTAHAVVVDIVDFLD